MKILFVNVNWRLFSGIDSGASNRSTMFVKALAKVGDVDVISFYKEPAISNIENCVVKYSEHVGWDNVRLKKHSLLNKIKQYLCVLNPYSYYEINPMRESVVDYFYNKERYDIIACRYVEDAVTCGLVKYKQKLVVEVDDSPASAAKRQLAITEFPNPWSRYTTKYRAYTVGWMSRRFLSMVLCSFYSNRLESPSSKSVYLPNITLCKTIFVPVSDVTPMRILIVGWLDYWPNTFGTKHFANNIFPRVKSRIPSVELRIAGKTNHKELLEELNKISGVSALGYVDDIVGEYHNARVCVVPIYHGAGTSVKFVEAMVMGRTVVSTQMGTRGFNDICVNGRDFVLANSDDEFVEKLVSLLLSPTTLNQIAHNGYRIAMENFSEANFSTIVCNTISKAMERQE